jgi:hypothetical protein
MKYHVIGQGSDLLVYCLEGVQGGVIAIMKLKSETIIGTVTFAIKHDPSDMYKIKSEFVDKNTSFARCTLHSEWGWCGKNSIILPGMLNKFKGYFSNSPNDGYTLESEQKWIESQFTIIKEVYDRNTRKY